METYLLKLILCSACCIAFYYLALDRQKIYRFRRFYLIASLVFALLVPLLTIPSVAVQPAAVSVIVSSQQEVGGTVVVANKPNNYTVILWIYLIVAALLAVKFVRNLFILYRKISSNEKLPSDGTTVVLLDNPEPPHTFLNYIFLNKKIFREDKVHSDILLHEKAHAVQRHTFDLLFLELLLVIFWFNPAFYFYKIAMTANHELLADDAVLENGADPDEYRELLLNELIAEKILFTNQFNFNHTKKRFKMMTKKSGAARYVSLLTLPLAVALCLVFAEKVPAKTTNESKVLTETSLPKTTGQQIRNNAIDVKPELNSVAEKTVSDTIPAKKTQSVPVKNNKTEKAVTTALPSQTPPPAPLVAQTIVDVMPEFPGGFNEFRKLIGAQFDTSKINPEEDMQKSEVTFVVLPDGTTANFETKGDNAAMNAELLRTAKAVSEGKIWKPAEKDGKPVAYMFKVPITMNFEKPKTAK